MKRILTILTILLLLPLSAYSATATWPEDVVGVWEFEGDGTDDIGDIGDFATYGVGPQFNTSVVKYGTYSYQTNGTGSYYFSNDQYTNLAALDPITIEGWWRYGTNNSSFWKIWLKGNWDSTSGLYWMRGGYGLWPASETTLFCTHFNWRTPAGPSADTWAHISAQWDSVSQVGSIYLDGVKVGDWTGQATNPFACYTSNNFLGCNTNGANSATDVYLDRIVVSNALRNGVETTPEVTTPTVTETVTQTVTQTVTKTITCTCTQTVTKTVTPTYTVTKTSTATRTITPTYTATPTATPTATVSHTFTATPTFTPQPTLIIAKSQSSGSISNGDTFTYYINWEITGSSTGITIRDIYDASKIDFLAASPVPTIIATTQIVWDLGEQHDTAGGITFTARAKVGTGTFSNVSRIEVASAPVFPSAEITVGFNTPTFTATPTYTVTPTHTISQTHTVSPTHTVTESHTASPTISNTHTITPTITETVTLTPTLTITMTHTVTPTCTATPTINLTPHYYYSSLDYLAHPQKVKVTTTTGTKIMEHPWAGGIVSVGIAQLRSGPLSPAVAVDVQIRTFNTYTEFKIVDSSGDTVDCSSVNAILEYFAIRERNEF